jgi:hypothetical protein
VLGKGEGAVALDALLTPFAGPHFAGPR